MLPDRIFFPLILLAIAGLVVLGAVWPQGEGARSPGPFGHVPTQQTPAAQAAMAREAEAEAAEAARQAAQARKAEALAAEADAAALRK